MLKLRVTILSGLNSNSNCFASAEAGVAQHELNICKPQPFFKIIFTHLETVIKTSVCFFTNSRETYHCHFFFASRFFLTVAIFPDSCTFQSHRQLRFSIEQLISSQLKWPSNFFAFLNSYSDKNSLWFIFKLYYRLSIYNQIQLKSKMKLPRKALMKLNREQTYDLYKKVDCIINFLEFLSNSLHWLKRCSSLK